MIRATNRLCLSRPALATAGAFLVLAGSGCANGAAPVAAPPGGAISTLPLGTYTCEMPGDAGGAVGKPMPEYEFRIVNSSSYKAGGIRGSYLFVGDQVTMTGGKLKGMKFHRLSTTFLRKIEDDGTDGELRCVRSDRN